MATVLSARSRRRSPGAAADMAILRAADAAPPPTLAALYAAIGPDLLRVVLAPRGVAIAIGGARLLDPLDERPVARGELLLGVGLDGRSRETLRALDAVAAHDGAGLLLRVEDPSPEVVAEAGRLGVALLTASPASDWGALHALIDSVTRGCTPGTPVADAHEDLPALADAAAALAGEAVAIADARLRILALSRADGDTQDAAPRPLAGALADAAAATADVVAATADAGPPCRAVAIRAAGSVVGYAWTSATGARAGAALREAARSAVPALLRRRTAVELERNLRADLMRRLLAGDGAPAACAAGVGLRTPARYTVIVFALASPAPDLVAAAGPRAADVVTMALRSERRDALAVADGACVVALVAEDEGASREALVRIARDSVAGIRAALKLSVRGGVGITVAALDEIGASRLAAERALRVGARNAVALADIEDMQDDALVDELAEYLDRHPRPRSKPLQRLIEHDRDHGTQYVATLAAYLDCFGDSARTSRRLGIHRNTVRYRLQRLAELAGVDLDQPTQRFALETELRLGGARAIEAQA